MREHLLTKALEGDTAALDEARKKSKEWSARGYAKRKQRADAEAHEEIARLYETIEFARGCDATDLEREATRTLALMPGVARAKHLVSTRTNAGAAGTCVSSEIFEHTDRRHKPSSPCDVTHLTHHVRVLCERDPRIFLICTNEHSHVCCFCWRTFVTRSCNANGKSGGYRKFFVCRYTSMWSWTRQEATPSPCAQRDILCGTQTG